jgi:hypothetical protein
MLLAHLAIVVFSPTPVSRPALATWRASPFCMSALADVPEPVIESSCSFDYIPLLTALKTAEFREADGLTRDALIKLAGEAAVRRGYVYFSEVPKLPVEDLATIDRLWRTYSGNKFGYSVQSEIFNSKKVSGNFDTFFERIGWTNGEGSLLRWLPEAKQDEFVYDVDKAVAGHLPLTSALRGTQLLAGLMRHPAWDSDKAS